MLKFIAAAILSAPFLGSLGLAHAAVQTKSIEYKVGSDTFVGFLAWDDAVATDKTPAPGVVVCPEWWGNNDYAHSRATQLAGLGYVALAIDLYGKAEGGNARTTSDPAQAGEWANALYKDPGTLNARVVAGLAALTSQPTVDKANVAAIGYCMGGTVALALARTGADVKAVVAFHASNIAAKNDADNANIKATVLICHGQDDTFVKPGELDTFHAQMKAAKIDYALYSYSGAVHAFTNPKADSYKVSGVAYDKNADARSWAAMKSLFEEKFGVVKQAQSSSPSPFAAKPAQPEVPTEVPAPLTDDQIAQMSVKETIAREMMTRRTVAARNTSIDQATKDRLNAEYEKLKRRLIEVALEKSAAPK